MTGGVCKRCRIEQLRLVEIPEVLEARVCPVCEARLMRGKWSPGELIDAVVASVQDSLRIHPDAEDVHVEITPREMDHSTWRVDVHVSARVYDEPLSEDREVEVRVKRDTCDRCSRIAGGYYEGVVQVRVEGRRPDPEEIDRAVEIAYDVVDRLYRAGDRMAFITKVEEPAEGADIYVGTHAAGRQISRAIISELGGHVSESPKLVGKREGKDIYRVAYAVRLPRFRPGDIIRLDRQVLEVRAVGKRLRAVDLRTGAGYTGSLEDMARADKLGERSGAKPAVVVLIEGNTVQILDPDTYQTVEILRPAFFEAHEGEEVPVIRTTAGLFILPEVQG